MNSTQNKQNVLIIMGGRSTEHEVSLRSARNIWKALDRNRYTPHLVFVSKSGTWHPIDEELFSKESTSEKFANAKESVTFLPAKSLLLILNDNAIVRTIKIDAAFPVMHGTFGEDGSIQGLFRIMETPFVGPSVAASAMGMDKDLMKRILRDASLPTTPWFTFYKDDPISFEDVTKALGTTLFVKPANLGSSVGVNRAETKEQFESAMKEAFSYDSKVIVEKYVSGREIECAVLGNDHPRASLPGEIVAENSFYSYNTKYIQTKSASLNIPANLTSSETNKVQELAVKVYKVLECQGLTRVDMFLKENGELCINEINTLPGFTDISMYPKLWEAGGTSQTELITTLLELAVDRYKKEAMLERSVRL